LEQKTAVIFEKTEILEKTEIFEKTRFVQTSQLTLNCFVALDAGTEKAVNENEDLKNSCL